MKGTRSKFGGFTRNSLWFPALMWISIAGSAASQVQTGSVLEEHKVSALTGKFSGPLNNGDEFGTDMAPIGDLDGNGVVDLIVGARYDDDGGSNRGAVWVLFLEVNGSDWEVCASRKISSTQGHVQSGGLGGDLDDGDEFGRSVEFLGDLDSDGLIEVAVGAMRDDDGQTDAGAVWILSLNMDGRFTDAHKIGAISGGFTGILAQGDFFGCALAAQDINGDGVSELVVGAHGDNGGGSERGAIWILELFNDGSVKAVQKIGDTAGGFGGSLNNGDRFGVSVAGLGDLNGDGAGDLVVGAYRDNQVGTDAGAIWILELNAGFTVNTQRKITSGLNGFNGPLQPDDRFGISVANIGDLDRDCLPEIAVGAYLDDDGGSSRGAAWVLGLDADGGIRFEQKISDLTGGFQGPLNNGDWFGFAVCPLGDVDGDQVADLAVSARGDNDGGSNRGAVWFLRLDGYAPTDLHLWPADPGLAGSTNHFRLTCATPNSPISLRYGFAAGQSAAPGCPGVMFQIRNAKPAGTIVSNPVGIAALSRVVPAKLLGRAVRIQALDQSNCQLSNLLVQPFL